MSDEHSHEGRPAWLKFVHIGGFGGLLLACWFCRDWLAVRAVYGVNPIALLVLIGGYRIFYEAISGLLHLRVSADLAVAIAAVAALVIGEEFAAAEVIFIMLVGEALEDFAVDRTERSIHRIIDMAPDTARVRRAAVEEEVPVAAVVPGDVVVVRPGERVPVDGMVLSGTSSVNEATITGEPMAASKSPGEEVHAGTSNEGGALAVEATRVGEDTTLARIGQLVEKGAAQRRADRWAVWFVPIVLAAAAATYIVTREPVRAVAVLVVACPCALVLATPTAVVAAIGRLAREGILIRGGSHLEALASVDTVAFDKTGTVTTGEPKAVAAVATGEMAVEDMLLHAASAEKSSEHGLGRLIVAHAAERGVAADEPGEFQAVPGAGVTAVVRGRKVAVGKASFLREAGVRGLDELEDAASEYEARGAMLAFCAVEGEALGFIAAEDPPRAKAAETLADLHEAGIEETLLLTGDHERAARSVRQATGIRRHQADLLPEQKAQVIRDLEQSGRTVMAVGDGVNDAPALATATVGVAMGDVATDITVDAADVVLATSDLRRIPQLIRFSRRTMATIATNVVWFALLFNGIGVLLSARGIIGPVGAAVYHQIASLLVCGNSLRLLTAGRLEERGRLGQLRDRIAGSLASVGRGLHAVRWTWVRDRAAAHRGWLARWGPVALVAGYMASGIYAVGPAEVVVVRRLGAECGEARGPGLHYRLPWPVDKVSRVKPHLVRTVEVGYRTLAGGEEAGGYEWENPHEAGAYEKKTDESLRLTGDETVLDVNVAVQYRIGNPHDYLFHVADEAALCRAVAESAVRQVIGGGTADDVLTDARPDLERAIADVAGQVFEQYESGIEVVEVRLLDVHPPMQVVPAFREVASALEEKRTVANQAEAYANEQVPQAKGRAEAMKLEAEAWSRTRIDRAAGDAKRFGSVETAHRRAPQVTEIRLHLEAVEKALAPREKLVLNGRGAGRRQMLLLDAAGLKLQGGPTPAQQAVPLFPEETPEGLEDLEHDVPATAPQPAPSSAATGNGTTPSEQAPSQLTTPAEVSTE